MKILPVTANTDILEQTIQRLGPDTSIIHVL